MRVSVSSASTGLCGGRRATAVPTATGSRRRTGPCGNGTQPRLRERLARAAEPGRRPRRFLDVQQATDRTVRLRNSTSSTEASSQGRPNPADVRAGFSMGSRRRTGPCGNGTQPRPRGPARKGGRTRPTSAPVSQWVAGDGQDRAATELNLVHGSRTAGATEPGRRAGGCLHLPGYAGVSPRPGRFGRTSFPFSTVTPWKGSLETSRLPSRSA